ncbi:MAG: hypothetical protein ACK49N_04060 [Verrucomicrobiota bacterium]
MAAITTKLTLNTSNFVSGIDRSKKSAAGLKSTMSSLGSGIGTAFSGIAKSVGAIGIAATGAAAAIGGIAYKLISIGEEGLKAENRIKNVVKTMGLFGDQSDEVADRLIKVADATELATGVDGDLIMASQAKLATFKELAKTAGTTGGAFDRATQASLDMAAVFGGDASNYAVQLGKALEDPEKGLASLKRTGALTTSQIKEISQEFAQTGNRARAFDQVLKAIETQVGGSASATASGMAKIKVSVGQMLEEIGKPMSEVFSKFATDVAKMTPQIVESLSGIAPKIREIGYTITAALAEALQGDTGRMVKIGELIGESVVLGFKVALTRGVAEATESALRLLEDINPIRKMSKWSQDTFGNDPFFNEGKLSEEVSGAKGPIMESQIEDGIARISGLFKEISVANTPQKQPPSDFFARQRAAAESKNILPTQPGTPEGPSSEVQKKAEELRMSQEQYRLEVELVRARIAGDQKRIDALQREQAIREEITRLEGLGMTGKNAKDTATKMVDARAAADQAAQNPKKAPGESAGVQQLGSVAKATNVMMGRSANAGILEENRRQTALLRTIEKNTKTKGETPKIPDLVFA